jgi:hypothetical protein
LTWRRTLYGEVDEMMGQTFCMGWNGGRLPTEQELEALIQAAQSCATQITWPAPPIGQAVWSSTADPASPNNYWTVFFDGTYPISVPAGDGHWVLCVR